MYQRRSTNNGIQSIIKLIRSLESRGILMQGTNRRNVSQKG